MAVKCTLLVVEIFIQENQQYSSYSFECVLYCQVDLITTLTKMSYLGQQINYEAYTYPVRKVDFSKLKLQKSPDVNLKSWIRFLEQLMKIPSEAANYHYPLELSRISYLTVFEAACIPFLNCFNIAVQQWAYLFLMLRAFHLLNYSRFPLFLRLYGCERALANTQEGLY